MHSPYELNRNTRLLLLPTLALSLAGCPGEDAETGDFDETTSSTGTDTSTSTVPTTGSDTTDPDTTGTSTTTVEPTTTTTDPTTTTTDPTTETDTTATTDTTTDTTGDTTTDTTGDTTTDTTGDTTTDTTGDTTTGGVVEFTGVWASSNPAAFAGDALISVNPALDAQNAALTLLGDAVSIQSVGVNGGGDGIVTYDAPGGLGGVVIVKDMTDGNPANGAIGLGNRVIRGPATGLIAPKGVEATGPVGQFIVADTGASDIKVFSLAAEGDVAPVFTVTDLGSSAAVWDVHYVGNMDTLYAAGTNGDVQVFEDFKDSQGVMGPDRTITPTINGQKISVNLHGIAVDSNTLYLSDVGDPMNTTDGQLIVINGASTAMGLKNVSQRIQGGMLGNPVDLELRPGIPHNLYIAEKSNDALLVYTENLMTSQFEFNKSLVVSKPESVALTTNNRVVVAANPAGLDTDAALLVAAPLVGDLGVNATFNNLGSINSVESLVIADNGDGFVSFDGPTVSGGGGVFVVPDLTAIAMDGAVDTVPGRIWGSLTGILTPKGLELNIGQDRLFIADTAAIDIKVFDAGNVGNVPPLFKLADLGGGAVWDVDYDDASDLLFAAGVDGTVRVFENVLADMGASGPARVFTPSNAQNEKISVNLHGIHYDSASKSLILSDVGSAMVTTDGQIFVIADADTAEGDVQVKAQIGGDQTKLGNPVDIAFDGVNLYVAEKSNSAVLRYDGVLDLTGSNNTAEAAMITVPAAESVQLAYTVP